MPEGISDMWFLERSISWRLLRENNSSGKSFNLFDANFNSRRWRRFPIEASIEHMWLYEQDMYSRRGRQPISCGNLVSLFWLRNMLLRPEKANMVGGMCWMRLPDKSSRRICGTLWTVRKWRLWLCVLSMHGEIYLEGRGNLPFLGLWARACPWRMPCRRHSRCNPTQQAHLLRHGGSPRGLAEQWGGRNEILLICAQGCKSSFFKGT